MPGFYAVHTLCLLCMPFATRSLPTGLAAVFLLGILMYLVNSPSQMLFLNTASEEYPSCVNLAASFNSVFFNLGIAAGSWEEWSWITLDFVTWERQELCRRHWLESAHSF